MRLSIIKEALRRHKRLLAVGVAIRHEMRASAAEIADAMIWHAARFSEPLDDEKTMRNGYDALPAP